MAQAFNSFTNFGATQRENMAPSSGFSFKKKRNPFRALSFEQEQEQEPPSFAEAYPREQMSAYERFLQQEKPQFNRSTGAKIGAALLAGIGGYAGNPNALRDSNAALRAPYEREMEEYEFEGGRLRELSNIETARMNQDRLARKAIQDYELAKADDYRQDEAARRDAERLKNTIRLGDNTIRLGDNTIENTGADNRIDQNTGNLIRTKPNTGESINLGNFSPSYGQQRTDRITDENNRDVRNFGQQRQMAGIQGAISRSNMFAGKQFDLDNPSPSSGIIPPNQQRDAEEMADQELLYGPNAKYKNLVEEVAAPTSADQNAKGLRLRDLSTIGVVEGQILQDLMKEYEREKAIRMNEILNKPRGGRYDISIIK